MRSNDHKAADTHFCALNYGRSHHLVSTYASLGIFYGLFTLLENECHKLDLLLAAQLGRGEVAGGPSFEDHDP